MKKVCVDNVDSIAYYKLLLDEIFYVKKKIISFPGL